MKKQIIFLLFSAFLASITFGNTGKSSDVSWGDPGDGKYYSTQPGVKFIMITNCCEAGPIGYKLTNESGTFESKYKKSYYLAGLFYNPNNNDFLFIYREKGVILDFTATLNSGGNDHDIKAVDIVSMDENVKSLARDTYKSKVVEVLAEQRQKKKAEADAEQKKKVDERQAPVDRMKNAELTKQAMACLNANAQKDQYGYGYSKAYIVSEDWWIVKHEYTGAVLKRTVEVAALYKKDGKCFLEYFSVAQNFDGTGFQKSVFYNGIMMNHDPGGDEIDCNKVK